MGNHTFAPEPVMRAALDVVSYACVIVRNATLNSDVRVKMVKEVMEAVHDIPLQLKTWDETRIEVIRDHLKCFDASQYPETLDLLQRFETLLTEYEKMPTPKDSFSSKR